MTTITVLFSIAILILLYSKSLNGKGPEAGVFGIILIAVAIIIMLFDTMLFAFYLGRN